MAGDKDTLGRLLDGQLDELLRIMEAGDVEELELEVSGLKLRLKLPPGGARSQVVAVSDAAGLDAAARDFILAERVGFFHRSTEDGHAPLEIGAEVVEGQVLGVIDSLSVLVPVQAPRPGRLEELLVEEGQAVEYGQPLFLVRAAEDKIAG